VSEGPCVPLVPAAMQHALEVAHAEAARLRARIAELEARTVKLPRFFEEELDGFEHGHNAMLRSVRERLGAAGVKWEEE
jgi:hypothetical protein